MCIVSVDPAVSTTSTPLRRLSGTLFDSIGAAFVDFVIPLVGTETAVVCFELYRRGLAWNVRNSPAATKARVLAQRRCDELVSTAEAKYQTDAVHLITELGTIDPFLPRSLASWESASWQQSTANAVASNGVESG